MVRTLGFMGTGVGADHLAVLARTGAEGEVRSAVAGWLLADHRWDIADLPRLDEDTARWLELATRDEDGRFASVSRTADTCPYITLPPSWDAFLRTLRSDARKDLGRRWRRLREQGEVTIEQVTTLDQLEPAWGVLLRLHNDRRQVAGGRSAFTATRSLAFHRAFLQRAAERGWLRLYLMRVGDRYVAGEYCLSLGGRVVDLQTGFDAAWSRFGVSTLLLGHAIEQAIVEGATEFDFLRGGEAYKQQRWAAALRSDRSLVIWRRRPRVMAVMAARRWVDTAKSEVRRRWPGRRASDVSRTGDAHAGEQAAEG
jgi:CelD/BcsL family acetyltransferase involved in cellulose biosynthesis